MCEGVQYRILTNHTQPQGTEPWDDKLQSFTGHQRFDKVGTASLGNLVGAAKLESSKMPSGANLVMANSSELIIPRNRIPDVIGNQNQPVQHLTIAPVFHVQNKEQILNSLAQVLNNSPVMRMVIIL